MNKKWDWIEVTELICNNSDLAFNNVQAITGLDSDTLKALLSMSIIGRLLLSREDRA